MIRRDRNRTTRAENRALIAILIIVALVIVISLYLWWPGLPGGAD